MNKKQLILAALVVGVIILIVTARLLGKQNNQNHFTDIRNGNYEIDGKQYELQAGKYEAETMSGSASRTIVQYFGNEATGQLNNDSYPDQILLLTKNDGGSGTFFYVVAALGGPNGYAGTNAVLLGDRIAPQSSQIKDMVAVVNFAERRPEDPMTTSPSIGVTKYFRINEGKLEEIQIKK